MFKRLGLAFRTLVGRQKTVATMVPTWQEGQPSYPEVNFTNLVKHGWRKNELIFACVSKTSNTAAQVELRVRRKQDDQVLDDHPLRQLIRHPNRYMNEFDFWASVIIYTRLYGRAYYEKERNHGGQVIGLWSLRPDWVSVIISKSGVGGYEYRIPGMEPIPLAPDDVLEFKVWDPLGMFSTWPPAAVAARVGDIDNAVTDYLKLFFQKGGTPPGLLKTVQKLQDAQVEVIRRRWRERYGGVDHWLDPAVLDSDAEYQKIGLSFTEMGFDVLDARNEARICMVMDVPPILVGAKVGLDRSTFANYAEARRSWWQDSLLPLYASLQDTLDYNLTPDFGDDIYLEWDFSRVPALQEERNERWKRATEAFRSGAITVNEFCEEVGLPTKGPAGEVYLRSATMVEVPAKTVRTSAAGLVSGNGHHQIKTDTRSKQEKRMQRALEGYFRDAQERLKEEL